MICQKKLKCYQQVVITFSQVECILQAMIINKICLFNSQHLVR